jgi:hypothetical protein
LIWVGVRIASFFKAQKLPSDCYSLRAPGQKLSVDALFGVSSHLAGLIENTL